MDVFAKTQSRPFYPDLAPLSRGRRRAAFWYSSLMATREDSETLRFEGTYGDSDVAALTRFSIAQVLDMRIAKATVSTTVLLAVGALWFRSWPVVLVGFPAILAVSALLRYRILPGRLARHARTAPGWGRPRSILVDGQGLVLRTEEGEQRFPRTAIRRMVLHKSHLFILLKPQGCIMLPLAWIHSPVTIETVVTALASR